MDWRQHINFGTKKIASKPAVPETRLSVEFLLGLFAAGWTEKQVLEKYPELTSSKLCAVLATAPELLEMIDRTREEVKIGKKLSFEDVKGDVWE